MGLRVPCDWICLWLRICVCVCVCVRCEVCRCMCACACAYVRVFLCGYRQYAMGYSI